MFCIAGEPNWEELLPSQVGTGRISLVSAVLRLALSQDGLQRGDPGPATRCQRVWVLHTSQCSSEYPSLSPTTLPPSTLCYLCPWGGGGGVWCLLMLMDQSPCALVTSLNCSPPKMFTAAREGRLVTGWGEEEGGRVSQQLRKQRSSRSGNLLRTLDSLVVRFAIYYCVYHHHFGAFCCNDVLVK